MHKKTASARAPSGDAGLIDASVVEIDAAASDAAQARDAGNAQPVVTRMSFAAYPEVKFPAGNPFDATKALLGKILFWDEQLSADDSVACGTCHRPSAGGSDPRPSAPGYIGHPGPDALRGTADDPAGSPGIASCVHTADGKITADQDAMFGDAVQVTRRRAMSFIDAMFSPALFWDGRAGGAFVDPERKDLTLLPQGAALETQALGPLQSPVEMTCKDGSLSELTHKLAHSTPLSKARNVPADVQEALRAWPDYPTLFSASFASAEITAVRIAMAIATYERTLTSRQTPWDRWREGDDGALTPAELHGFQIFASKGGCSCCHAPPLFGSAAYANDGFSLSTWDKGRAEVVHDTRAAAAFRVPSLRNVALREPGGLLHDGLAPGTSLDTLVDAYMKPPLIGGSTGFCVRRGVALDPSERDALLTFLRHALTDPRVQLEAPPFDRPQLGSEVTKP